MASLFFKVVLLILMSSCLQSKGFRFSYDQDPKGWPNKEAEIYFLIDCSSSVYGLDHEIQLKFVSDLVEDMDIDPTATRVGVGIFSEQHTLFIGINNTFSKSMLQKKIMKATRLRGKTYFSRALQGMREQGLPATMIRPGVPKIAVLLTDGDDNMSSHQQLIADNATLAKREGIFIFTVSIGYIANKDKIRAIASDPKADHFFSVPYYSRLQDIRADLSQKMSEVDVLPRERGICGTNNTLVDTVFVFDEAGLGVKNTEKVKGFLSFLVDNVGMDSGNVRVGVISKSCQRKDIMLGEYVTREDFKACLHNGEDALRIRSLLETAWLDAFKVENGGRMDAKRRIVLIMHARIPEENQNEMFIDVTKAKNFPGSPIEMFVIRMGPGQYLETDVTFINSLASDHEKAFIFDSPYHLTDNPKFKQSFLESFCRGL